MSSDAQARLRLQALTAGLLSQGLSAAVLELLPLLDDVSDPTLQGEINKLLGFYWLRQGQHAQSLPHSRAASLRLPQDRDAAFNLCYALCQLRRLDEAMAEGESALARLGEHDMLLGLMTNLMAVSGRADQVRHYGTRTLAAKDSMTGRQAGRDLAACVVPAFDPSRPARNVISFSLYGAQPRYVDAAVWNAEALPYVYPGWTCRYYLDGSVPQAVVQRLLGLGAQVLQPTKLPAQPWGTFWRLLVADDPEVDRYLVRDADSLVNLREAAAVQQWLASGRHFHLMRDHFDHCDVVLAGMWGGVRGALPPLGVAAQAFLQTTRRVQNRTADQEFLCEQMWPTIRRSMLVHDSQFSFGDTHDFPSWARLPTGCWVGGDARALRFYGRKQP